jgi:hypothetical protein
MVFGPSINLGLLNTINIGFIQMTSIVMWADLCKNMLVLGHMSRLWLVQHGVNLIQKEVSSLEEVGFMFDLE